MPIKSYWPKGSALYSDNKSVETPFAGPDTSKRLTIKIGPFKNDSQSVNLVAFVIHYNDNTWDNNSNNNYIININTGTINNISWTPISPTQNDSIKITVHNATKTAYLHWGVNSSGSTWEAPNTSYFPKGSTLFEGTCPAVESPMSGPDASQELHITLGPFNNSEQLVNTVAFDIHYTDNTWDNNSNSDYHIPVSLTTNSINNIPDKPFQYAAYVYPNPASNHLICQYKSNLNIDLNIRITDIRGSLIKDIITNSKTSNIDLSNIDKGIYIVTLSEKYSNQTFRKKIVIL